MGTEDKVIKLMLPMLGQKYTEILLPKKREMNILLHSIILLLWQKMDKMYSSKMFIAILH